jgi:hypothetical protein
MTRRVAIAFAALSLAVLAAAGLVAAHQLGTAQAHPVAELVAATSTPVPAKEHTDGDHPGIHVCKHPVAQSSVMHVHVPNSGLMATVYTFRWNGNVGSETTAPTGWKPATASPSELKFFGIPERPTNASDLAQWKSEWIDHFSSFGLGTPCADKSNVSAG